MLLSFFTLLIRGEHSGNYAVTKPESAEEAAWEDIDEDNEDDASNTNKQESIDHTDTEMLLMTHHPMLRKSIKSKTYEAKKVTKRSPRGFKTPIELAATQELKKEMANALKGVAVTEVKIQAAVEQSMYRHSADIASQHSESGQASTMQKVGAIVENVENSVQDVKLKKAVEVEIPLPEQSTCTVSTLSAKDKFIQAFGDRAQPTPPKPFSRGSFGEIVFGVFYVGFLVVKLMLGI